MTVKPPRAAMISWRPGSGTDAPSAAAMVAKSSPKAKPTEAAAQALSTLWAPVRESAQGTRSTVANRAPSSWSAASRAHRVKRGRPSASSDTSSAQTA